MSVLKMHWSSCSIFDMTMVSTYNNNGLASVVVQDHNAGRTSIIKVYINQS